MCRDDALDLRCLLRGCRRAPTYQHKILYVGANRALAEYLNHELKEFGCFVDYCSALWLARAFIESDINYALLLVDEQLTEMTGAEFTLSVHSLRHRKHLPSIALKKSDDFNVSAQTILSLLTTS